jgi:hypothetical protein
VSVGERNAQWRSIDESVTKQLALGRGKFGGVEGFDLCVSGDGLTHLQNAFGDDRTRSALAAVTVWARVSPQQKEYVLAGSRPAAAPRSCAATAPMTARPTLVRSL